MGKFLLVIAHANPNETSISHRLAKASATALTEAGHSVKTLDLVKSIFLQCASKDDFKEITERFDYLQMQTETNIQDNIKEQQEIVRWADTVIVYAPIWFWRLPACFYAFQERIFTRGFYPLKEKKRALFVVTAGGTNEYYSHGGFIPTEAMLYTTTYPMHRCNFEVYRSLPVFNCETHTTEERIESLCNNIKKIIVDLENRPLLEFGKNKQEGKDEIELFGLLPNLALD
ncbi:Flavodoxin-like fold family protein [Tritrichomonas foetus]|uniref:Flavodoxin-like fold family protein n=1 Tax=Tritrichomonas foetus TaxID=1144522 RepID=A0A1J4JPU3_9EUKA|nr:Flavodoxin-like fold family protein [Tritrichomonas foetus]|eukprot:OHS99549.1 Flavodoxin-like fold family protein [Tritrichomonas foetus]